MYTHRVRTHAVLLLLVSPPSECEKNAIVVGNEVLLLCSVIYPVTLIWPLNTKTVPLQGHSLHQVWTLCDHSFLSYAADNQTNRQTDSKILPTPTDIVGMGRFCLVLVLVHLALVLSKFTYCLGPITVIPKLFRSRSQSRRAACPTLSQTSSWAVRHAT